MPTRLSEVFFRRPVLLWAILAVNFLASIYGYYWYRWQLRATPWWLWPFVPDCPLAATLMAAALALYLFWGRRESPFQLLTYAVLVKYGLWTVFVLGLYRTAGGAFTPEDWMLFVSHLGMLAEGVVFLGSLRWRAGPWWFTAFWSAANDFFDYFYPVRIGGRPTIGVYPYLPNEAHLPAARAMALAITACFFAVAVFTTFGPRRRGEYFGG